LQCFENATFPAVKEKEKKHVRYHQANFSKAPFLWHGVITTLSMPREVWKKISA